MKLNSRNINKRFKIITLITLVMFVLLSLRLAILTIAKGQYFREISENTRIKDIYITAPRGEIRDRNGILLAGNKPMFTLQILKDEFNYLKPEEKNKYILDVITLLERDGISYNSDFPLSVYSFSYSDTSDYFKTEFSPSDRIVEIIIENNLIGDILNQYYINKSGINEFSYYPAQNLINSLEFNSKNVPITYGIKEGKIEYEFLSGIELTSWYIDNNIPEGTDPKNSLIEMVDNSKTIIKKLLSNPINRKIIYDIIKNKGLEENIILQEIEITYKNDFNKSKIELMKKYPEINMDTSAEQDFIILFVKNSLREFLKHEIIEEKINVPEQIITIFNENNINVDFEYTVDKENKVKYISKTKADLTEEIIIDNIVEELIKNDLVLELINIDDNIIYAQQQLIKNNINSGISISEGFEYVSIINLNNFLKKYDLTSNSKPKEIINNIRNYYSISEELSIPEVYGMLNVYHELNRHGNLAYLPVNFSYGLKNETVAKVEEQLANFEGFQVSLEPVRSYPKGESASHIIGYMGKISQEFEIKEYIENQGYNPDTLIGKTGIEESFQKNLYGENGSKKVEVDSLGNTTSVLNEVKPKPGDNIYLSIDYQLQKRAEDSLDNILRKIRTGGTVISPWGDYEVVQSKDKGRPYKNASSGAVMAVDVKTGEVLAMASYPSYDPNLFSTGISSADWEGLLPENNKDPLAPRPLYNVVTQTAVQPGSTFKMVTALAGLEKGLDPELGIDCRGFIEMGDTTPGCWIWNQSKGMHGPMNVVDAIRDSCNYYFYSLALGQNQQTGASVGVRLGIEDISQMAEKFGLGSKTGLEINIPKEAESNVPNPAAKRKSGKNLLKRWLDNNIDKFYIGDREFKGEFRDSVINSIVSWIDLEETLSLKEVYDKLSKLEIDGTKRISDVSKDTLADIIKFTYLNNSRWTISDTINITIGQGENSYTLAQMTNYVATIANDGHKNKLTLINNIKSPDNSSIEFQNEVSKDRIELNNYKNLEYLRKGMLQASKSGVNRDVFSDFPIRVGLKTGTAERSGVNPVTKETYDSFAYEVAFAPYDDPRIAVGVVIFQGGSGSNCSPIVREVIAEYMGLYRQEESDNLPIEMDIIP